jgi:hypothetical protein
LLPEHHADGFERSDHASFWGQGYPAVLIIEDYNGDFNPNLHKTTDRIGVLNMPYFTSFVKASLGTVAHLAGVVGGIALSPTAMTGMGLAGEEVDYVLSLRNLDRVTDTVTLGAVSATWPVNVVPLTVSLPGALMAPAVVPVVVTVSIPLTAVMGASHTFTVTATSASHPWLRPAVRLTTLVTQRRAFLPVILCW